MKQEQIQQFVSRYLEASGCQVIEKNPGFITVKLSPQADRDLVNRPYYWNFVERTGAVPETMTLQLYFDLQKLNEDVNFAAAARNPLRIPRDPVIFGSRRLEQMFAAAKMKGRCVQLFEEPESGRSLRASRAYSSWLAVNFKVEFLCDLKRDELYSLAVQLNSGKIAENFHRFLLALNLTPRLPTNVHLKRQTVTFEQAANLLEEYLLTRMKGMNHRWADDAHSRWRDEQARIDEFYGELLKQAEADKQPEIEAQYQNRIAETEWQHRPRIQVSVINCGLFHLQSEHVAGNDERR